MIDNITKFYKFFSSISAICFEAIPSPYELEALDILLYSLWSDKSLLTSSYIVSSSVPTNFNVPAFISSGLSVVSLNTSTCFSSND